MKISYYALWDEIAQPGVARKIRQTVDTLVDAGHEADVHMVRPAGLHTYVRFALAVGFSRAAVLIIRFHPYVMPLLFPMLIVARLRGRFIVIDVPTPCGNLVKELDTNNAMGVGAKRLRLLLLYLSVPWLLFPASRIVQYAPESSYFQTGLRGRSILSANGIRVDDIPVIDTPVRQRGEGITLIGVAALAEWHGYDRVIKGIAAYPGTGRDALHFLVVGDGAIRSQLESLAETLGISDRVEFVGVKHGADLDQCFERADIGLGTLAFFRLNMDFASSLKSREYAARGLPFVLASTDPDFDPLPDFVFRAPNVNTPLDTRALIDWYGKLRAQTDLPARLRAYAHARLDFSVKIKAFLP